MLSQIFSTAIIADPKYVVKFETEIMWYKIKSVCLGINHAINYK